MPSSPGTAAFNAAVRCSAPRRGRKHRPIHQRRRSIVFQPGEPLCQSSDCGGRRRGGPADLDAEILLRKPRNLIRPNRAARPPSRAATSMLKKRPMLLELPRSLLALAGSAAADPSALALLPGDAPAAPTDGPVGLLPDPAPVPEPAAEPAPAPAADFLRQMVCRTVSCR